MEEFLQFFKIVIFQEETEENNRLDNRPIELPENRRPITKQLVENFGLTDEGT